MAREAIYDDGSRVEGFTGLLLHDTRVCVANLMANDAAAGNSSYTQAGRRPGVPVFDQAEVADTSSTAGDLSPSIALGTSGEQSATSYHVKVLRGGMPGTDGAMVAMRPALTSAEQWRGRQTPNVVTYVHGTNQIVASMAAGVSGFDSTRGYACCTAQNGTAVWAIAEQYGVIRIETYSPETRSFGTSADAADPSVGATSTDDDIAFYDASLHGNTQHQCVELLTLPTGRIVLLAIVSQLGDGGTTGQKVNLMSSYSDDHGASWRTASYWMLRDGITATYTFAKLRACNGANGTALVLIEYTWDAGTTWGIVQYASRDMACTFDQIEDWRTAGGDGRHFDCVSTPDGMITVVYHNETDTQIEYRRIGSPFTPLSLTTATLLKNITPTNIACCADLDGTLYATWDNVEDVEMARSVDGGTTWQQYNTDVMDLQTATEWDWDLTPAGGCLVWMLCDPLGVIAGGTRSFFLALHSGGWDTLTNPQVQGQSSPPELYGYGGAFGQCWFPFRLPTSYAWTKVGAGTTALRTATPFGVSIVTAAAQAYYEKTTAIDATSGVLLFFAVEKVAGGSLTAEDIAVNVQMESAATDEWQCSVRFSGTQVRVVDTVSGATIGDANIDITSPIWFKLAMRKWPITGGATTAGVTLYASGVGKNEWVALVSDDNGLTRRVPGGAATSHIRWGAIANSTAESDWHHFLHGFQTGRVGRLGPSAGNYGFFDDLALNPLQGSPMTLFGAPLPAQPSRLYLEDGLYIHAAGGPATRGDTWKIEPSYSYPVTALDPVTSPSPGDKWRSSADNAVVRVAWNISAGYASQLGNNVIGAGLFGFNVPTATLKAWNGAAYVTLGTVDFRASMTALPYLRSGDTITVDTGTVSSGAQWIAFGELVGATVDLGGSKYRKVRWNSEGAWTEVITKRPTLHLDGIDGTEASSGTLSIWYPDAILLVHTNVTAYSRYAIEFPAQVTADGYYEGGVVVIGPAVIFGHKYSRNRVIRTEPIAELFDAADGSSVGRELNTPRRTMEASWVEGVDTSGIWRSAPVPDYLSARTGTDPFAARGDATLLEGVIRYTGGPARTLCYVPRFAQPASGGGSANLTQLAGKERCWYGRLTDIASRQTTNGSEVKSEVVTLTGLRFREEK